jgi:membrane fusion protein, multidrug efflux system
MSRFDFLKPIVPLSMCLFLGACFQEKAASGVQPTRPVLSVVVAPRTTEVFGPFTGTIQPRFQSSAGFQIVGRMITRDVNVGELVKAGRLLASLDSRLSRFSLNAAQADAANARASLINAEATEDRQRQLLASTTGATTQAQADTATANRQTAQARLDQALATSEKANEQVGYTELHADYDGIISSWDAEVGQVVSAGQAVVTIARPDVREAVFDVPSELMGQIPPNAVFTVSILTNGAISAQGKIREITPLAETSTRTQRIRLSLDDPPTTFRLGTTVTVSLSRSIAPVIEIPTAAVLEEGGKATVWIVTADDTVEMRVIEVGKRKDRTVEVSRGLVKGDRVVTAGIHSLTAGRKVRHTDGASK